MEIGVITGSGTYALPGFEGGEPEPVTTPLGRGARLARHVRRRRRRARVAPRDGPRAALQPRRASRQHRRAGAARRRRRDRRHGLRGGRPGGRARLPDLLRRPALHGQPAAGRLALHVLRRAGRSAARALDLRGPVRAGAARIAAGGRRALRTADARRRLLRPRRRPALQHEGRDPRAGRRRRDRRLADGGAGDACSPARPSCRSRSSATRPTTPTASRPSRRRSSGCWS